MDTLLISKAVSQLLLPPGGLILLGLVGLLYYRRWWGKGMAWLSLALFWLLAMSPVRDALIGPLESQYPPLALTVEGLTRINPELTAIILLGGGAYENAPEYGGLDQLSPDALMRTNYAAELVRKTGLPVYATGGAVFSETSEPEGEIMRRWLIRLGVPESGAFAENLASNTWENARLIKPLLERAGIRQVILVTNAWHMPRSVWSFESQGMKVLPAPCAYETGGSDYILLDFLPHWQVLGSSGNALHEYLGIAWYRLHYGGGD